jgi:hypothetical protein
MYNPHHHPILEQHHPLQGPLKRYSKHCYERRHVYMNLEPHKR